MAGPITERTFDVQLISGAAQVADACHCLPRGPFLEKISRRKWYVWQVAGRRSPKGDAMKPLDRGMYWKYTCFQGGLLRGGSNWTSE